MINWLHNFLLIALASHPLRTPIFHLFSPTSHYRSRCPSDKFLTETCFHLQQQGLFQVEVIYFSVCRSNSCWMLLVILITDVFLWNCNWISGAVYLKTVMQCSEIEINRLLKKKHLAVRRLNYVYNIQVIVKMDLKNYNNKNVQI